MQGFLARRFAEPLAVSISAMRREAVWLPNTPTALISHKLPICFAKSTASANWHLRSVRQRLMKS